MAKSPGHEKMPDHKIEEKKLDVPYQAKINGIVIAESSQPIQLSEDGHPDRIYFPRSDVNMMLLERSETTTKCPFKGTAHYFSVRHGDTALTDAVWTYEDPYDEHRDIQGHVAFDTDQFPQIEVGPIEESGESTLLRRTS